jgi:hypothetical protein
VHLEGIQRSNQWGLTLEVTAVLEGTVHVRHRASAWEIVWAP